MGFKKFNIKKFVATFLTCTVIFSNVANFEVYAGTRYVRETYEDGVGEIVRTEIVELQGFETYADKQVFRYGLAVVSADDFNDNYINEDYKLEDLNRGRFSRVWPFFEGLAAFTDKNTYKVGYMNTDGDIVIPATYDVYDNMGMSYLGYFKNGKATVFKRMDSGEYMVGEIDTTGKLVKDFTSFENYRPFDNAYLMHDGIGFAGKSSMNDSNNTQTYFQSKANVESISISEFTSAGITVRVTNDTDKFDSGVVAIVTANLDESIGMPNTAGVFSIKYDLEPHTSGTAYIPIENWVHQLIYDNTVFPYLPYTLSSASALKGVSDAKIIIFDDYYDYENFLEAIPYEDNWDTEYISGRLANMYYRPISNGSDGTEFLAQLGMKRSTSSYYWE